MKNIKMYQIMYKKIFLLTFILLTSIVNIEAQKNVSLNVGDSLTLGDCSRDDVGFTSMDLIVKTRFPENEFVYNDSTGEGFFNWFLGTGDFDSRRLPTQQDHFSASRASHIVAGVSSRGRASPYARGSVVSCCLEAYG